MDIFKGKRENFNFCNDDDLMAVIFSYDSPFKTLVFYFYFLWSCCRSEVYILVANSFHLVSDSRNWMTLGLSLQLYLRL